MMLLDILVALLLCISMKCDEVSNKSKECLDIVQTSRCRLWRLHFVCHTNQPFMEKRCSQTCGYCEHKNHCLRTRYGCCPDGVTSAFGRNFLGCQDNCRDIIPKRLCESMKKVGYCTRRRFRERCHKTCTSCRVCKDRDPNFCKTISDNGLCKRMPHIAANKCRKSCQKCGVSDPCFNTQCPENTKCRVNHLMQAFCSCREHCRGEEHITGKLCGRDGKTYSSLCMLKQENCNSGNQITVKYYGECKAVTSLPIDQSVPFPSCETSKYGCCNDGQTEAIDPAGSNCPKSCKQNWYTLCDKFTPSCGVKDHFGFMKRHCPKSCHYCM